MAIAWVANTGQWNVYSGSSSSIQTDPSVSVTSGNAIVVCVQTADTAAYRTVSGITDTAGNTYSLCGSRWQYRYAGAYYFNFEIWVALNITGHASNQITASYATANLGASILAGSWSGMATSGAYDTGYDPAGNVDATSVYTTTSDSTAEDNELVIGFFISSLATSQTKSSSSPSVLRYVSPNQGAGIADNVAATAGAFTVSVASTVNEDHFCFAKAFKQAAGGASSTPTLKRRLNILLRLCLSTFNLIWRCFK